MPTETPGRVETNLGRLREKRALSVAALSRLVNVTRQTIYAIESGDYVPNTAVALRLARALDVTVEELFRLPDTETALPPAPLQTDFLPDTEKPHAGEPVQLCRMNKRLIATRPSVDPWYLPSSDGVVLGESGVQAYQANDDFDNRILLAGCDPAVSILARHLKPAGIEVVCVQRNSSRSLDLLRKNCVHIAGTHLRDDASGESNAPEVRRRFPKNAVSLITFAVWEEGIVTARGNRKRIKGVEDLTRRGVSIVNREIGAGSRRLLDKCLGDSGIAPGRVRGYNQIADGHFSAARQVAGGTVDCCIATGATARAFGLDFIPLATERYDLAIRRTHLKLPTIETLLDVLNRSAFRRELEGVGGYETRVSGDRVM